MTDITKPTSEDAKKQKEDEAKKLDRDLALLKTELDIAANDRREPAKTQYTHPAITIAVPNAIMGFIVYAGASIDVKQIAAVFSIAIIAGSVQHLIYASHHNDENNRIDIIKAKQKDVLDGKPLNSGFSKEIDNEVKARSRVWSKLSPTTVFRAAAAGIGITALLGVNLGFGKKETLPKADQVATVPRQTSVKTPTPAKK